MRFKWTAAVFARTLTSVVLAAFVFAPAPVLAEWFADVSAGYVYDDNLPNALKDSDHKGDGALGLTLRGGIGKQLRSGTSASVSLVAEYVHYLDYEDLTNAGAGAQLKVRHKFGVGSMTPWASLSVKAMHYDYQYDYRDGWQYNADAAVGKRISERVWLDAHVRYDRFAADEVQAAILPGFSTDAYDIEGWELGARVGFAVASADYLSFWYSRRKGTVVAVTPPGIDVLQVSDAIARDPVFSFSPFGVAYRFADKLDTDTFSLSWSHEFGTRSSISASYTYGTTKAPAGIGKYESRVFGLNWVYNF